MSDNKELPPIPMVKLYDCQCLECHAPFVAVPYLGLGDKECAHCHKMVNVNEMMKIHAKWRFEDIKPWLNLGEILEEWMSSTIKDLESVADILRKLKGKE